MMNLKSGNARRLFIRVLCVLLGFAAVASPVVYGKDTPGPDSTVKIIMIDPGHGGADRGAQGPEGTDEKNVTLELAKMIASKCAPSCRVILTRSGDYGLPLYDRTSLANRYHADLFISLHTGGSFRRAIDRWTVYYYQPGQHSLSDSRSDSRLSPEGGRPVLWDDLQAAHLKASALFADILQEQLKNGVGAQPVLVAQEPLRVLAGADMPAVLVEAGYLTSPGDEKKLTDPDFVSRVADAICNGINDYFAKTGDKNQAAH